LRSTGDATGSDWRLCVEAAQVRVTCDGCGGAITVPLRPQSLLLGEESR